MRSTILIVALLVAASACGDVEPNVDYDRVEYQVQGGIAGIDETWVIRQAGRITTPDGTTVRIDDGTTQTLVFDLDDLGFFDMAGSYLPDDPCCDRFTYRITAVDATRDHTVVTMDDVDIPDALADSLQLVTAVVHEAQAAG